MKIIKILLLTLIIYFFFISLVFISVDSPKNLENINLVFDDQRPLKIELSHLLPQVNYQVFLYLDKQNDGDFKVFDEDKKIIFETKENYSETIPIKLKEVINKDKIFLYFSELSPEKSEEELKNEKKKEELKIDFYNRLSFYLKNGDYMNFFKEMESFSAGQIPGYEKIPALVIKKPSVIKQVIARPKKDFHFFLIINKIILDSYIKYLNKDIPFRIFYLLLLSFTIWQILRVRKEIS